MVYLRHHFFIPMRQESDVIQHLGEKSGDVCAAREAENIDLISRAVEAHQKAVAADDVFIKRRADGRVFSFHVPGAKSRSDRGM